MITMQRGFEANARLVSVSDTILQDIVNLKLPEPPTAPPPMSAKTEAKEGRRARGKAPAAAEKAAGRGQGRPRRRAAPRRAEQARLFAAIAAIVLAPALSWGVAQFVLLPQLEKKLSVPDAPPAAAAAAEPAPPRGRRQGGEGRRPAHLRVQQRRRQSGGDDGHPLPEDHLHRHRHPTPALPRLFEANKARMTDVTLNVLSALTLADLEEPGSKNVLREKLVAAYNEALGRKVADQVYFSDFVVQ